VSQGHVNQKLPYDFVERRRALEDVYLKTDDPMMQSGYDGGAKRWKEVRKRLLA
jgi:hypothetical protein